MDGELGKAKIAAMAQRIALINPQCKINLQDEFISQSNMENLMSAKMDYVIDCIDDYRVKAMLIAYCRRQKIKLITIGGAGGKIDPGAIGKADLSRSRTRRFISESEKTFAYRV